MVHVNRQLTCTWKWRHCLLQHYQWVCLAAKNRTSTISAKSINTSTQSADIKFISRTGWYWSDTSYFKLLSRYSYTICVSACTNTWDHVQRLSLHVHWHTHTHTFICNLHVPSCVWTCMYIRTDVRTSLNVHCVAVRGYSVCLQCLRSHSVKVKIAMIVFYSNAACYHNRQTPFEETLCAFDLFSVFCTFNTFKWAHFIDLYIFWFYSLRGDHGVSILLT